jgi:epoxyqueuosine reductase
MEKEHAILQSFYKVIQSKGYKAKIVHAKHVPDLINDIKKHHEQKSIFPKFYEEYKSFFEFTPKVDFGSIKSLIVIAVPVPQYEITFSHNSKQIYLKIPPTYLYGLKIVNGLEEQLKNIFNPKGYNVAYARLPVKTLAVRSGLAEYGRNNITYVEDMGSFHRLVPFYSDFPIEDENWNELEVMDSCDNCNACVRNCPTGAIPTDRFLLRVEKCLTYHNEQPGNIPFPDWIDPTWHNCLVGCLHCQKICPANKKVKDWTVLGPIFSEEETKLLLAEKEIEKLPDTLRKKIEEYDLDGYYEVYPRNISPFLEI